MAIIRWKPFEDLDDLLTEYDFDIATDIYEENNKYVVEMHIPGVQADKLDISVENNRYLHVSGSREQEQEKEKKHFYKKEIKRGQFERVITLPSPVSGEDITAEAHDGCLKISLPKKKTSEPQKVQVSVKKS